MRQFPMPCLNCGVLTKEGNRCATHQREYEIRKEARKDRSHYKGDYKRRAKMVRDSAEICWICNEGYRPDDPWTADHFYPGQPDSPLLPAHRSCNSRRGNSVVS